MQLPRPTPGLAALATIAFTLVAFSASAEAACKCRCVDGKAQAVCSSSTDIRPICQSSACPIAPPAKSPTDARQPPPVVKPGCETKQVYDPETRTYAWDQICK
jgi:hypothetical protein